MKTVTIAFDIDGTVRNNKYANVPIANERIRTLLVTLASFKNTKIILWSGGGEIYARQIANAFGITKYIDEYADKQWRSVDSCIGGNGAGAQCIDDSHNHFGTELQPDIAIDDMQKFNLGKLNLIVREK